MRGHGKAWQGLSRTRVPDGGSKGTYPYSHVTGVWARARTASSGRAINYRLELQRRAICAASYSVQHLAPTPPVEKPSRPWVDDSGANMGWRSWRSTPVVSGSGKLFMLRASGQSGHNRGALGAAKVWLPAMVHPWHTCPRPHVAAGAQLRGEKVEACRIVDSGSGRAWTMQARRPPPVRERHGRRGHTCVCAAWHCMKLAQSIACAGGRLGCRCTLQPGWTGSCRGESSAMSGCGSTRGRYAHPVPLRARAARPCRSHQH